MNDGASMMMKSSPTRPNGALYCFLYWPPIARSAALRSSTNNWTFRVLLLREGQEIIISWRTVANKFRQEIALPRSAACLEQETPNYVEEHVAVLYASYFWHSGQEALVDPLLLQSWCDLLAFRMSVIIQSNLSFSVVVAMLVLLLLLLLFMLLVLCIHGLW